MCGLWCRSIEIVLLFREDVWVVNMDCDSAGK